MMLRFATRTSFFSSRLASSSSLLLSACLLVSACGDDGAPGTASAGETETGGHSTDTTMTSSPSTSQTTTTMGADADGSTTMDDTTTGVPPTTSSDTTQGEDSTGTTAATEATGDGSTSDSGSTSGSESTGAETGESSSTGGDCNDHADCQDGSFCNGEEQCIGNVCMAGTPVVCNEDDGIACTVHTCSEQHQACVHQANNALCPGTDICDPQVGCVAEVCLPVICQNQVYECGDCEDNDGDGLVDMNDPNCWGPCDNNEAGWKGEIPGQQNQSPCNSMDCYFDKDGGSGNDGCYWSHTCDPEMPNPSGCNYNPNYKVPGSSGQNCGQLFDEQSNKCLDYCGPLTPNGCDCFGCCDVFVDGDKHTVYLGSEDAGKNGTCNLENAANIELCHPCTKVVGCLNSCEECELCIGKDELPPECDPEDQCPEGVQPCGLEGQDPCNAGFFCLTGCCTPIPL